MNSTRTADESHLRTLSICYYILACLNALSCGCALTFVAVGIAFIVGIPVEDNEAPPPEFGILVSIVFGASALLAVTLCILEVGTGRSLGRHMNYRFTFVMACIELINVPLGTILAIFTIIVLSRPSVIALYAGMSQRDPRLDTFDDRNDEAPRPMTKSDLDEGSIREGDAP